MFCTGYLINLNFGRHLALTEDTIENRFRTLICTFGKSSLPLVERWWFINGSLITTNVDFQIIITRAKFKFFFFHTWMYISDCFFESHKFIKNGPWGKGRGGCSVSIKKSFVFNWYSILLPNTDLKEIGILKNVLGSVLKTVT